MAMAADDPDRYVAKMTKSIRGGKIFIDYLRNSRSRPRSPPIRRAPAPARRCRCR